MKQLVSFFFVLFFFVSLTAFGQDAVYDAAPPSTVQADTIPPAGFPYTKLFTWYYGAIPGVNGGTVGGFYFNNLYYMNRWNSTMLYRYNGALAGPTTLADSAAYQGSIRDLTTNGTFLYGGAAAATVYRMNANGITQGTITLAGGVARAIAYSPDENVLFASNFGGAITVHNITTGALIRSLTNAATGKYGMGYSNYDGPKLWVWEQGADQLTNVLEVLNPTTGATIAGPYTFTLPALSVGIAGGAEVCVIGGYYVLLLNYQNFAVQGFQLAAVPVELTSFTASAVGNSVSLNWSTASETNNSGFNVERSVDGVEFTNIGFVEGKGTTSELQNYSFVDNTVSSGTFTYRLKQVDLDGSYQYSPLVEVDVTTLSQFALNQNYPNPFNPSTTINFNLAVDSKVTVRVFDLLGQEVASLINNTLPAGAHNVNFDASSLNSGAYFYQIEATGVDGSNFSSVKKMMLTK
jgi:hypothetical protein